MRKKIADAIKTELSSSLPDDLKVFSLIRLITEHFHHKRGVADGSLPARSGQPATFSDPALKPENYYDKPLEYPTIKRLRALMGDDFLSEAEAYELLTEGMHEMEGHSRSIGEMTMIYNAAANFIVENSVSLENLKKEVYTSGMSEAHTQALNTIFNALDNLCRDIEKEREIAAKQDAFKNEVLEAYNHYFPK